MSDIILISDGEDDIISIPGPSRPRTSQPLSRVPLHAPIFIDDSDDDQPTQTMDELVADFMAGRKGKRKASFTDLAPVPSFGARSALLDLLENDSFRLNTPDSGGDADSPSEEESSGKKKAAKKKKVDGATQQDKADKAAEAARKREEKEQAKNQDKEEKVRQKEEAKLAKEIARSQAQKDKDVNKLRRSKEDTVREIHVYMTADLMETSSPIAAALPEIRSKLEENLSKLHTLGPDECFLPSTIRFKRHVKAMYDGRLKKWVALDRDRWEWESTTLIVVQAEAIVDLITSHADGLAEWASDARLTLGLPPTDQIMVIIKGLQKYYSKSKTIENREFAAAARAGLGERDVIRRDRTVRPDRDRIEAELVRLQVTEHCFLVHVEKTEDIESWIYNLAADVAIRPYKLLEKSHLNFCPPDNKGKASDPMQAFEMMLQEVHGVTPSAAAGIAAEYSGFKGLMDAYDKAERRGGAALMLQHCEIRNLKNGTANARPLHKAKSTAVWTVFRGEDGLALA